MSAHQARCAAPARRRRIHPTITARPADAATAAIRGGGGETWGSRCRSRTGRRKYRICQPRLSASRRSYYLLPVLPAPHVPGPRAAGARGQKPGTGGPTVTLATATRSAIRPRSATRPPRPEITATHSCRRGATTPRRRSSRPIPGGQLPPGHGGADRTVITAVGAPETAGAGAGALPLHTTASLPFHTTRIPQHPRRSTISPRGHCTPRISHRVNSPPGRSRPPTSGPADIPRPRRGARRATSSRAAHQFHNGRFTRSRCDRFLRSFLAICFIRRLLWPGHGCPSAMTL